MTDKYVRSGEWRVRLPDGEWLNMNSEKAVCYLLGLLEQIKGLEAQLRKRNRRKGEAKRRETNEQDDGDA